MITKDLLLYLFEYDRENGALIWKNPPKQNRYLIGKKAESFSGPMNHLCVMIQNKSYKVHKLIMFIETGRWFKCIDHINGIPDDNRITNLRPVTTRQNQQNQKRHRNGKLVGASFHKASNLWRATIKINGKSIHLGRFNSELEAHCRYLAELKERGF